MKIEDVIAFYPENPRGIGAPIEDHLGRIVGHRRLCSFQEQAGRGLYLQLKCEWIKGGGTPAVIGVPAPLRTLPGTSYAEKCDSARKVAL